MKIFGWLAFSALLMTSVSGANAQDFDKGLEAINAGDYQTALKEMLPLAESGDARAQSKLGEMYLYGNGVIQNDVESLKWYRLAADQGHADAQFSLGVSYVAGRGVVQNYVESLKWYRLAADQGHAGAQHLLGFMYRDGHGVIQNNLMAHMWYNISSANGEEISGRIRDEIAAKMTREDISKAQAMAQDCISSGYKNCGD